MLLTKVDGATVDKIQSSIVPFRQCKLTELLFSNSFPSSSQHTSAHSNNHLRNPQKAVMIVTADPVGDFNATSQILRYSALAREVTVPRVPSVVSTIYSNSQETMRPVSHDDERQKASYNAADVEILAMDVVKLGDEVEVLSVRLAEPRKELKSWSEIFAKNVGAKWREELKKKDDGGLELWERR